MTGTSFAAPFVSGSGSTAMMEWGIVRKEMIRFFAGEKVKAYLRRGAQPLPGYEQYPNVEVQGWGEDVIIRLH